MGLFVYNLSDRSQQGARIRVFRNILEDNNQGNNPVCHSMGICTLLARSCSPGPAVDRDV